MTGPYRIAPEFDRKDTRELRKFIVFLAWTPPENSGSSALAIRTKVLAKDGSEAFEKVRVSANEGEQAYKNRRSIPHSKIWFSEVVSIEDFYIDKKDMDEIERLNSEHNEED